MLRSNINVNSLLATGCQLPPVMSPVYFMLIHCPPHRKRADENNRDMLQLPCGSVDIIAQNCFELDIPDPRGIGTPNTTPNNTQHNNTSLTDNQLVSTNKHKRSLSPSILRQLEYSNTLLYLAQSPKTPLGVNPFSEAGANPPLNGSNGFLHSRWGSWQQ